MPTGYANSNGAGTPRVGAGSPTRGVSSAALEGANARRLLIYEEHAANKMMPADTGAIVVDALTFADDVGEEAYFHDEIVWCDDTSDATVQMSVYRHDLGLRIRPARKSHMRKFSYEWLAGLREIVVDSEWRPLTFAEFTLKEHLRDRDGA